MTSGGGGAIPTAELASLFDPFRQASRSRGTGLGLGLYIVQQIALGHGATCSVTSSAQAGTAFAVRWPRVRPDGSPRRPVPTRVASGERVRLAVWPAPRGERDRE